MALVETRDLVKTYRMGRQTVHALNGVTMQVEKGEFTAIMGRSGSGKSTLLNLIGCLDRPTSGAVFLDGRELNRLPDRALPHVRREQIGFVFQSFNLIPALTVLENVMLPMRYARVPGKEARRRAQELLEAVEMDHRLNHRPTEISGGEQQRVAIARALVRNPAVVLADEPTGELDSQTATTIVQLMRQLNQSLGKTFLIVTHDPLVAQHSLRTVRLKDGSVESDTAAGAPPGNL